MYGDSDRTKVVRLSVTSRLLRSKVVSEQIESLAGEEGWFAIRALLYVSLNVSPMVVLIRSLGRYTTLPKVDVYLPY